MTNESYTLAEIVMAEKSKEKFATTVNDELLAINIYAAQKKMDQYLEKFNVFFEGSEEFKADSDVVRVLAKTLVNFEEDKHKNDRLMLATKLQRQMRNTLVKFDGDVLHSLVYVFSESQQWEQVAELLKALAESDLCEPHRKTLKMVRGNLVYVFQN